MTADQKENLSLPFELPHNAEAFVATASRIWEIEFGWDVYDRVGNVRVLARMCGAQRLYACKDGHVPGYVYAMPDGHSKVWITTSGDACRVIAAKRVL